MTEFYREYLAVAVLMLAAIGMVAVMLGVGRLVRPSRPQDEKYISYEAGSDPVGAFGQSNVRYYVYALLMAELFPEKKDAILAIGRDIGWDRVLIGKHFPTDVQAGRVLGQAIFREVSASAAFTQDLAEAKAEVQAAQPGHR